MLLQETKTNKQKTTYLITAWILHRYICKLVDEARQSGGGGGRGEQAGVAFPVRKIGYSPTERGSERERERERAKYLG